MEILFLIIMTSTTAPTRVLVAPTGEGGAVVRHLTPMSAEKPRAARRLSIPALPSTEEREPVLLSPGAPLDLERIRSGSLKHAWGAALALGGIGWALGAVGLGVVSGSAREGGQFTGLAVGVGLFGLVELIAGFALLSSGSDEILDANAIAAVERHRRVPHASEESFSY